MAKISIEVSGGVRDEVVELAKLVHKELGDTQSYGMDENAIVAKRFFVKLCPALGRVDDPAEAKAGGKMDKATYSKFLQACKYLGNASAINNRLQDKAVTSRGMDDLSNMG